MKNKCYFSIVTIVLCLIVTTNTYAQTVVITTVVDGTITDDSCAGGSGSSPRFIELYVDGTIDFTGYDLDVEINGSYDTAGIEWVSKNISSLGTISDQFVYLVLASDLDSFDSVFSNKTRIGVSLGTINGNDSFRIEDNLSNILDSFGNPNEITNSSVDPSWDYQDSYAKRKDFILPNNGNFVTTNWTYGGANSLDGLSCEALANAVTLGSYSVKTTNWIGINSNWEETGNWDNGIPTLGYNAIISDATTSPIINTNINANIGDLTISNTDGLSVLSGTITISGNLLINTASSLYLESKITASKTIDAASVILNGNYTSTDPNKFFYFTETFNDNTSGWTLISSPTIGEKIDGNTGDGNFAVYNKLQESATNYGIAKYDNSQSDSNLRWNYYSKAEIDVAVPVVDMENGKGYSVLPNSILNLDTANGNLGFKGAIPTSAVSVTITDNSGLSGNAFNLIGNPYPSFIPANNAADTTYAFLNINTTQLAEETLYVWDKTSTSYQIVNQLVSRYIAPGQGFFIKSKTGGGTIKFTEAMQSHQTSATFNKTSNKTKKITLKAVADNSEKTTEIYYIDGKTTGFDNGYDSSIFGGLNSSFDLFTKLVSNNDERQFGIQTLPTLNYETMVIPVGVNTSVNNEITFSASALNLPENINIYLEDKLNNTITQLNLINTEYKTTISKDDTKNRFYIHAKTSSILNTESQLLNTVDIFKTSNSNLKITGLKQGKTTISIFNILSKIVMNTTFETSYVKNITIPKLAAGVYIVKLLTEDGILSKKIILE